MSTRISVQDFNVRKKTCIECQDVVFCVLLQHLTNARQMVGNSNPWNHWVNSIEWQI